MLVLIPTWATYMRLQVNDKQIHFFEVNPQKGNPQFVPESVWSSELVTIKRRRFAGRLDKSPSTPACGIPKKLPDSIGNIPRFLTENLEIVDSELTCYSERTLTKLITGD